MPILVGPAIGLLRPRLWNVDAAFRIVLAALVSAPVLALAYWATTAVAAQFGATAATAGWWGALAVGALAYPAVRLSPCAWRRSSCTGAGRMPRPRPPDWRNGWPTAPSRPRSPTRWCAPSSMRSSSTGRSFGAAASSTRASGFRSSTMPRSAGIERFPIVFHGEELAELVVPPRRGESSLTDSDREVVERIAVHAAPALHGARALAELSDAHARLVLAREEERRRLRRDLHDDLSPTLSGLSLAAAAVAKRAATAAPELAEQAAELHRDIQAAVEQSREIAYGLRPPILDDRGLVAAIRDRVHGQRRRRAPGRGARTRGRAPAAGGGRSRGAADRPGSGVERAPAREGEHLHHHARTTRRASSAVQVDDDGVGIPPRVRGGLGLASMRERAAELGGSARFGTAPRRRRQRRRAAPRAAIGVIA